METESQAI